MGMPAGESVRDGGVCAGSPKPEYFVKPRNFMSKNPFRRLRSMLRNVHTVPAVAAWLVAFFMKMLRATYRISYDDPYHFIDSSQPWPVIVALWHNRILFTASCFPKEQLRRSGVLISASRDGEYAARIVRHFGLNVLRGSSSRGGFRALRSLMGYLREGKTVVLAVDGPRGPRYVPQQGAVALAVRCSVPILPISLNAPSRWNTRSWDRTQIPKPFTRMTVKVGKPLYLTEDNEESRAAVEKALAAVTDDTER